MTHSDDTATPKGPWDSDPLPPVSPIGSSQAFPDILGRLQNFARGLGGTRPAINSSFSFNSPHTDERNGLGSSSWTSSKMRQSGLPYEESTSDASTSGRYPFPLNQSFSKCASAEVAHSPRSSASSYNDVNLLNTAGNTSNAIPNPQCSNSLLAPLQVRKPVNLPPLSIPDNIIDVNPSIDVAFRGLATTAHPNLDSITVPPLDVAPASSFATRNGTSCDFKHPPDTSFNTSTNMLLACGINASDTDSKKYLNSSSISYGSTHMSRISPTRDASHQTGLNDASYNYVNRQPLVGAIGCSDNAVSSLSFSAVPGETYVKSVGNVTLPRNGHAASLPSSQFGSDDEPWLQGPSDRWCGSNSSRERRPQGLYSERCVKSSYSNGVNGNVNTPTGSRTNGGSEWALRPWYSGGFSHDRTEGYGYKQRLDYQMRDNNNGQPWRYDNSLEWRQDYWQKNRRGNDLTNGAHNANLLYPRLQSNPQPNQSPYSTSVSSYGEKEFGSDSGLVEESFIGDSVLQQGTISGSKIPYNLGGLGRDVYRPWTHNNRITDYESTADNSSFRSFSRSPSSRNSNESRGHTESDYWRKVPMCTNPRLDMRDIEKNNARTVDRDSSDSHKQLKPRYNYGSQHCFGSESESPLHRCGIRPLSPGRWIGAVGRSSSIDNKKLFTCSSNSNHTVSARSEVAKANAGRMQDNDIPVCHTWLGSTTSCSPQQTPRGCGEKEFCSESVNKENTPVVEDGKNDTATTDQFKDREDPLRGPSNLVVGDNTESKREDYVAENRTDNRENRKEIKKRRTDRKTDRVQYDRLTKTNCQPGQKFVDFGWNTPLYTGACMLCGRCADPNEEPTVYCSRSVCRRAFHVRCLAFCRGIEVFNSSVENCFICYLFIKYRNNNCTDNQRWWHLGPTTSKVPETMRAVVTATLRNVRSCIPTPKGVVVQSESYIWRISADAVKREKELRSKGESRNKDPLGGCSFRFSAAGFFEARLAAIAKLNRVMQKPFEYPTLPIEYVNEDGSVNSEGLKQIVTWNSPGCGAGTSTSNPSAAASSVPVAPEEEILVKFKLLCKIAKIQLKYKFTDSIPRDLNESLHVLPQWVACRNPDELAHLVGFPIVPLSPKLAIAELDATACVNSPRASGNSTDPSSSRKRNDGSTISSSSRTRRSRKQRKKDKGPAPEPPSRSNSANANGKVCLRKTDSRASTPLDPQFSRQNKKTAGKCKVKTVAAIFSSLPNGTQNFKSLLKHETNTQASEVCGDVIIEDLCTADTKGNEILLDVTKNENKLCLDNNNTVRVTVYVFPDDGAKADLSYAWNDSFPDGKSLVDGEDFPDIQQNSSPVLRPTASSPAVSKLARLGKTGNVELDITDRCILKNPYAATRQALSYLTRHPDWVKPRRRTFGLQAATNKATNKQTSAIPAAILSSSNQTNTTNTIYHQPKIQQGHTVRAKQCGSKASTVMVRRYTTSMKTSAEKPSLNSAVCTGRKLGEQRVDVQKQGT